MESHTGDVEFDFSGSMFALEKAVHQLRFAFYFGLAIVLIAGVLVAAWLFKQSVRRVDEASGAMQSQIDQRAKATRLNIEGDLDEIRRQLKESDRKDSTNDDGANSAEASRVEP